jgi:RNA polymerase sigma-70 factor, ECF subfamily
MAERAEFIRRPVLTVVEPVPQELVGSSCPIQRLDHDAVPIFRILPNISAVPLDEKFPMGDVPNNVITFPNTANDKSVQKETSESDQKKTVNFTELWQDEEWRAKKIEHTRVAVSQAFKGKPKSREHKRSLSEARGGIRNTVYPLLLRGGLNQEIAEISGIELGKIESQMRLVRKAEPEKFPSPSPEESNERKSRAMKFLKAYKTNGMEYTQEQKQDFQLVKELLSAGLITDDLAVWDEMKSLFEERGRALPESFAKQLRLEVFFEAAKNVTHMSEGLMALYNSLGKSVDPEFNTRGFTVEEEFIFTQIATELTVKNPSQKKGNVQITQFHPLPEQVQTMETSDKTPLLELDVETEVFIHPQDRDITKRSIKSRIKRVSETGSEEQMDANKKAVSFLVEHHHQDLTRFARKLCQNESDAEDLVQKTYLRLLSTSTQLIDPESKNPRSYAFSTMNNIFIDRVRNEKGTADRRRPEIKYLDDAISATVRDTKSEDPELHAEFHEVIETAKAEASKTIDPQGFEDAFMAHYLLGFSHSEVADRMQLPLGTVKTRLRLMKERTIRALQDENMTVVQRSAQTQIMPMNVGKILKRQIEAGEEHIEDPAYAAFLEQHGNKLYSYVFFNIGMDHKKTKEIVKKVERQLREGNYGSLPQMQDKHSIYDFVTTIAADEISAAFTKHPQEPHMTAWGWASKERNPHIQEIHIYSADMSSSSQRIAAMEINKV